MEERRKKSAFVLCIVKRSKSHRYLSSTCFLVQTYIFQYRTRFHFPRTAFYFSYVPRGTRKRPKCGRNIQFGLMPQSVTPAAVFRQNKETHPPPPHVYISSFLSSLYSLLVGRYSTPPSHPFLRRPAPFFDRGTRKFGAADADIRGDSSVITIGSPLDI